MYGYVLLQRICLEKNVYLLKRNNIILLIVCCMIYKLHRTIWWKLVFCFTLRWRRGVGLTNSFKMRFNRTTWTLKTFWRGQSQAYLMIYAKNVHNKCIRNKRERFSSRSLFRIYTSTIYITRRTMYYIVWWYCMSS